MIKLPKLKWIKIKGYRNIDKISGRIKSTTISKESNGKYYVSVLYEISDKIILLKVCYNNKTNITWW